MCMLNYGPACPSSNNIKKEKEKKDAITIDTNVCFFFYLRSTLTHMNNKIVSVGG